MWFWVSHRGGFLCQNMWGVGDKSGIGVICLLRGIFEQKHNQIADWTGQDDSF